ncbi:MAG: hypothetical protein ACRD13_12010 [Terriglobales bacterium]
MLRDPDSWRWLSLAIAPQKLPAALATLNGERRLARIYPHAAILHLYRDGRQERIPVAQLELALPPATIPQLLTRLESTGTLDPAAGGPIILPLAAAREAACMVLPAPASAPYVQIVRWRGGLERAGR